MPGLSDPDELRLAVVGEVPHLFARETAPDGGDRLVRLWRGERGWSSEIVAESAVGSRCTEEPRIEGEACSLDFQRYHTLAATADGRGAALLLYVRHHLTAALTSTCYEQNSGELRCSWEGEERMEGRVEIAEAAADGTAVTSVLADVVPLEATAVGIDARAVVHVAFYDGGSDEQPGLARNHIAGSYRATLRYLQIARNR